MLYGINSVAGAMQARRRRLARLYLKAGRPSSRLSGLRTQAEELGLTVTELSSGELERPPLHYEIPPHLPLTKGIQGGFSKQRTG